MSRITTHILDLARGVPAAGVAVSLDLFAEGAPWHEVGRGVTDGDGRCRTLLTDGEALKLGTYRLTFDVATYHRTVGAADVQPFFPEVSIVFVVREDRHHHVPLLLSPFGYSTYRGS